MLPSWFHKGQEKNSVRLVWLAGEDCNQTTEEAMLAKVVEGVPQAQMVVVLQDRQCARTSSQKGARA